MYKIINNAIIFRIADSTYIPTDETNTDYAVYLTWLAEGHTPTPADVPPPPTYQEQRALAYPSFADQFDALYHGGYDAWKAEIQSIKERFPK